MSTRFYFPPSGTPAATPAHDSLWTYTSTRRPLLSSPNNVAMADFTTNESSSSVVDAELGQWVGSDTLPAGAISGTFQMVVRCQEVSSTIDAILQCVIRVVSGDGSTVRGTLYAGQTATTSTTTVGANNQRFTSASSQTRLLTGTLSSVTAQAGDRLVVEVGYRACNTLGGTLAARQRFGTATAQADYAYTAGTTADGRPWIEFSQDVFATTPTTTAPTSVTVTPSATVVPVATTAAATSATVTLSATAVAVVSTTAAATLSVVASALAVAVGVTTAPTDVAVNSTATAYVVGGAVPTSADTTVNVESTATAVEVLSTAADTTVTVSGAVTAVPTMATAAGTTVAVSGSAVAAAVVATGADQSLTATSSAIAAPATSGPVSTVDLSTFVDLYDSTVYDSGILVATPPSYAKTFTFPFALDPATTYTVEVDVEGIELDFGDGPVMADCGGSLYSSLGPTEAEADESYWYTLDEADVITGGTGTLTFEIGPGINDWDGAVAGGEHYVIFSLGPSNITAIRITPPIGGVEPADPVGTDAENDAYKLTLGGWGVATWEPAVVLAPATTVRHAVVSAIAYGPVTMQGTQPVFTYSEADRPRLRQRILLGGHDVTFDRDVPTPDVEYELADLLLYGPGTLDLPQYVAFAEIGTEPADRWAEGRRVKVQLVDDTTDPEHPSIEATIYKGFVLNPSVSGRNLSLELGGEAAGRLNLRDSKVLFREILGISRLIWRELTDVGVRFLPRLGEPDPGGTRTLNFTSDSKLAKVEELLSRDIKKDGTQRAVLPDEQGAYRKIDKDTETIHFSVFVDDAFTVPDLSSDIAEKPNTIYATAIAPNGMRIDGAAVPGLISTPAPDYPMDDNSSFDEGTTNEDTDSGAGVSVMINRLGAVGLLDIRDTPGGFDEDVADALAKLQRRAGLTGPVGVMTPALWRALWDLDVTGRSGRWSSIQPTAQDPSVQRYLRAASGAPIGLNPDRDENALQVDESIDMGTGFRERQVQNWAETRVHAPGTKVWYGTITLHLGAVLAGQHDIGATITAEDLVDARLVQPGRHNLWVPNFDGGTLFGISGVQVRGDSIVLTVDTRFRPAREIWERLQVRRETRNDPARRMLGTRQSTQRKDAVRGFISWGGTIDRNVPLVPGWNVVEVVLGDYGTIARIETAVQTISGTGGEIAIEGHEYALAVFGKSITADRLNALVPTPLAEAGGDRPWRRGASARYLRSRKRLYVAGTFAEPCGYGEDMKNDPGATLTGAHFDEGGFPYECEHYIGYLAVWVHEEATLLRGRIMWPLLEGGV